MVFHGKQIFLQVLQSIHQKFMQTSYSCTKILLQAAESHHPPIAISFFQAFSQKGNAEPPYPPYKAKPANAVKRRRAL